MLRDGSIDCPNGWDLIERLKEKGFFHFDEDEPTTLTVEIPNNLTESYLDGLNKLVASKATLFSKVMGTENPEIW